MSAGLVLVVGSAPAAAPGVRADGGHGHGGEGGVGRGRVGVLLADHGEPPEYNEWTYESFREFFAHLIAMGGHPVVADHSGDGHHPLRRRLPGVRGTQRLAPARDAWLRPHEGPAAFVPASDSLPAHYVSPGGPGFREPDIYEHVGLSAWHEWQRMGGRSPNYDEKLAKKKAVVERLRATYGDGLAVRVGYGIDPRIGGGRQGIREALDALVNRDRIDSLVVVYHGVGFSDIMQTHHLRHQVADHLETLGVGDMPVRYAAPLGTTDAYVAAIVAKVRAELALLPPDAAVALHLSGHGLSTTTCGEYEFSADAYHRYAAELFARVRPAVEAAVSRPGRTGVFHIYGDSGEGDADPDDKVDGPLEALDARAAEGFAHVVDIPYEFDSNSRDTLIVLRQGYGRPQPDWNPAFESHFTMRGLQVKIANANGGEELKTDALEAVTVAALGGVATAGGGGSPVAAAATHDHGTLGRAAPEGQVHAHRVGVHAGTGAPPTPHPQGDHDPSGHHVAAVRFDRLGAAGHADGHGTEDAEAAAHGHGEESAGGDEHGLGHGGGGGAGAGVGLLLALAGGAALAAGIGARGRILAGRLAAGGLAAQLAGLGWDVVTHAQAGEGVHLLENGGHWLAMAGLMVTAVAAALLLVRSPAPMGTPAA